MHIIIMPCPLLWHFVEFWTARDCVMSQTFAEASPVCVNGLSSCVLTTDGIMDRSTADCMCTGGSHYQMPGNQSSTTAQKQHCHLLAQELLQQLSDSKYNVHKARPYALIICHVHAYIQKRSLIDRKAQSSLGLPGRCRDRQSLWFWTATAAVKRPLQLGSWELLGKM